MRQAPLNIWAWFWDPAPELGLNRPAPPSQEGSDHKAALERIEAIWSASPGTPEFSELDALATLVEHHEDRRWPAAWPRSTGPASPTRC